MQKGKKNLIKFLNSFSAGVPLRMLVSLTCQRALFPFYHSVSDDIVPHIRHLYDVRSFEDFKSDIEYLLKFYEPVGVDHLMEIDNRSKKRYMFLSFDDGLRQVNDFIAPYLYKKGIPAHFFINSAFLNNRALMFRYKISLIIEEILNSQDKEVVKKVEEKLTLGNKQNIDLKRSLLNLRYEDIDLIDEIAVILHLDFDNFLSTYKPYLTTNDIKSLMNQGFTFGSHSIDHPEFQYIKFEDQVQQVIESIRLLEIEFGTAVRTFAFPFTDFNVKNDFFEAIEKQDILDYSFGGAGIKKEKFSFHKQRIPIEEFSGNIKKIVHTEYLYYLLKMPFGKNLIKRK